MQLLVRRCTISSKVHVVGPGNGWKKSKKEHDNTHVDISFSNLKTPYSGRETTKLDLTPILESNNLRANDLSPK